MVRAIAFVLGLAALGCGGEPRPTPAGLEVVADPEDARVYVDGRFVASARVLAHRAHRLPAGVHQITITAPGYFPHDIETELPPGVSKIEISLRPVPP
ncbi:MAG: PEGA domain-containing protein [Deltaproteobacteria bacterium]|nr:PEGA domain-containing protein [Deltaproteobacteria bacterium]